MADRIAEISRKTEETDIRIKINLDGKGDASSVDTGIGFFDHMLKSFAKHGLFDLEVAVKGDLYVDFSFLPYEKPWKLRDPPHRLPNWRQSFP